MTEKELASPEERQHGVPAAIGSIQRFIESLITKAAWVTAGGAVALVVFMVIEMVGRYLRIPDILWGEELSRYAVGFITVIAAAWVLRVDGHVRVRLFYRRLSPKWQQWIDIASFIIGLVYVSALLKYFGEAWFIALEQDTRAVSIIHTPMVIPRGFVLIGLVLLWLELAISAVSRVWAAFTGRSRQPSSS